MASRVPILYRKQKKLNSLNYLKEIKRYCSENKYAEAYRYFIYYFKSLDDPSQSSSSIQTAFTKLVCKIGTVLEETDNVEELLKCYLQAINLFPNNFVILNNLGAYMFRIGEVDIARRYLELAVKANENYLPAEKNLIHVKWHQLPRWHFRMLNDVQRNTAYENAITSTVNKGYYNIVDIGSGCGLLSLVASRNPTAKIIGIEENKTLYKVSIDILKENNVSNVNILNCYSTDLTEPPSKCNLLVTEIFDVALFGERALETILHALTVLRTEEDYKIIPCGARVYVTGVSSNEILSKHSCVFKKYLRLLNLENTCIKQYLAEPYEAECLSEKNVCYVTDTCEVFHINFYNYDQISSLLNEDYCQILQLKCKKGVLHALTVWFILNLTEEISITTNPLDENCISCWEQAVFYLDHPIYVEEGEIITVKVTVLESKLHFTILNKQELNHECHKVSKEIITLLNDEGLVEAIVNTANKFNDARVSVVDSNIFPLLGFLLAKNGCTVYHTIKNECDKIFFQHILEVNNIPADKFLILNETLSLEPNIATGNDHGSCISFFNPIDTDGSINNVLYKDKMNIAKVINIPQIVKVNVQLISSWYIDHCNKVKDENVLNFKIGKFMNEYMGNEHPNLENFSYTKFSNPLTFILEDGEKLLQVSINQNGKINALYFWYDIQFYEDIVFSTLTSSHFKKSCFFFNNPKTVNIGDTCTVSMQTDGSYFKFVLQ